jgi:hypothetical protein
MDERLVRSLEVIGAYLRWVIAGEVLIALLLTGLLLK